MKKKKLLIIGSDSYIAKKFFLKYKSNYSEIFCFSYKVDNPLFKLNLFDPDINLLETIIDGNFNYALITAGITNLLICEKEKKYTYKCNVDGIVKISKFLSERNITPIIFSSDYVFDGSKAWYTEKSSLNPLNQYGFQKAQIERKIQETCNNNFLILRLSKIVSCKKDKTLFNKAINNFLNKIVVKYAYDQIFCPIEIDDLLDIIMILQQKNIRGIFNICGNEAWSRFELINQLIKKLNLDNSLIKRISLKDLKEPFRRPKNTTMKCDRLMSNVNFKFMNMNFCLEKLLKNYYQI